MPRCAACGSMFLFGGEREGRSRYCNQECRELGRAVGLASQVPEALLMERVRKIHEGPCPRCRGKGTVDVHTSHWVTSMILVTRWGQKSQICCRRCGISSKVLATLNNLFLGWWGFPFGLVLTPVQIGRNIVGLLRSPHPRVPSEALREHVRYSVAREIANPIEQRTWKLAD